MGMLSWMIQGSPVWPYGSVLEGRGRRTRVRKGDVVTAARVCSDGAASQGKLVATKRGKVRGGVLL